MEGCERVVAISLETPGMEFAGDKPRNDLTISKVHGGA
jgi:hypothetical protein